MNKVSELVSRLKDNTISDLECLQAFYNLREENYEKLSTDLRACKAGPFLARRLGYYLIDVDTGEFDSCSDGTPNPRITSEMIETKNAWIAWRKMMMEQKKSDE